jgi:hypothetical protein
VASEVRGRYSLGLASQSARRLRGSGAVVGEASGGADGRGHILHRRQRKGRRGMSVGVVVVDGWWKCRGLAGNWMRMLRCGTGGSDSAQRHSQGARGRNMGSAWKQSPGGEWVCAWGGQMVARPAGDSSRFIRCRQSAPPPIHHSNRMLGERCHRSAWNSILLLVLLLCLHASDLTLNLPIISAHHRPLNISINCSVGRSCLR